MASWVFKMNNQINNEERLAVVLEMLEALARLDFSKSLPVLGDGSTIDALIAGLNMLAEELQHSVVSKAELIESRKHYQSLIEQASDGILV